MNAASQLARHKLTVEDYHRMGEAGILSRGTELIDGEVLDQREGAPQIADLAELLEYLRHRYSESDFRRLRQLGLLGNHVRLIDGILWSE